MAATWYYRYLVIFYLLLYHFQILCFYFIVQDGYYISSHHFCINLVGKEKREHRRLYCLLLRVQLRSLSHHFYSFSEGSVPFHFRGNTTLILFIYAWSTEIFVCFSVRYQASNLFVFSSALSFGCHPLPHVRKSGSPVYLNPNSLLMLVTLTDILPWIVHTLIKSALRRVIIFSRIKEAGEFEGRWGAKVRERRQGVKQR